MTEATKTKRRRPEADRLIGPPELAKLKKKVDKLEADLLVARAERNRLIFHACENGLTEREAAIEAGVSYGWAGRCHRHEGFPERERT